MEERYAGAVFVRSGVISIGAPVEGHTHNFDHMTYIARGTCLIKGTGPDGTQAQVIKGPGGKVLIRKDWTHSLEAVAALTPDAKVALDAFREALLAQLPDASAQIEAAYADAKAAASQVPVGYDCTFARRTLDGELILDKDGWVDDPNAYV